MDKKSISASILVIFVALFFSVVGICFSVFVYQNKKTIVEVVNLVSENDIKLYSDEQLTNKITKLKLSNMDLGLKPATGELDIETEIPSTITDEGTSEGYYATVYVDSTDDFIVKINNIKIDSDHDELLIEEEKKNIFVAIKDIENSVKTLENNDTVLATFQNVSQTQKLTFLIWLGSLSTDELEGAKISFDLKFELAN